jgi:uncharacterized protein (DUF885 family)
MTSAIHELSSVYVEESAAADPISATFRGIAGHDTEMTDFSPEGHERRADIDRRVLAELVALEPVDDRDRVAGVVLEERLRTGLEIHDAREHLRDLNNLGSPVQAIRQVFDLMPHDTDDEWDTVVTRLEAVPDSVESYRTSLAAGVEAGLVAAKRQALTAAAQCATWSGDDDGRGYFSDLVASAPDAMSERARAAAAAAEAAYGRLGEYLSGDYAAAAGDRDGVGAERYRLWARAYLGAELDLDEVYQWGWQELHALETEMARVADVIVPGGTVADAMKLLETDPARAIEGVEGFRRWNQALLDDTVTALDGTHFDIPDPVKRVEAMIAPPGGAAAMYYTGPSEDFSRPGRTWYPTQGRTVFPLWGEVSICYHEGVPGHHLQIGQVRYLSDRLSRFQRMTTLSGHAEGWALYAERLMDELGFLDNPDHKLGMLRAQVMRAVRVVVDIGMHTQRRIPDDDPFSGAGQIWTPELGQKFVNERSCFPEDFMASEVVRYLGLPGQAICYKVGERVFLEGRAYVERRHGADFDLKAFHTAVLDLGPLGLDTLRDELARL